MTEHLAGRWGIAVLVAIAAAGNGARAQPATDAVARDLEQQRIILRSSSGTPPQREEAAKRLVQRSSPESRRIVAEALSDAVNPQGQLSVAKALVNDPQPDVALVEPLATLIGPDPAMTRAAASALAAYAERGIAQAWPRLEQRSTDTTAQFQPARADLVRAMGRLTDKRAAKALVGIMTDPTNDDRVRSAAAAALVEMTGLASLAGDFRQLERWWERNRNMPDDRWQRELKDRRASRAQSTEEALRAFAEEAGRKFQQLYDAMDNRDQRQQFVTGLLTAQTEPSRVIGVDLVWSDIRTNRFVPQAVLDRLRDMVGDSSADVRQAVARTLGTRNDPAAVEALLAQFRQEGDVGVRVAIASALGPMRDLRALEPLIDSLGDEFARVAEAAAGSLQELGPLARDDAALARKLAATLRQRLAAADRGMPLRERLVVAMATLRDPSLLDEFNKVLDPLRETAPVRAAAVTGIGEIPQGDPNTVVARLDDPSALVREAAARAVARIGTFAHVGRLEAHLVPPAEPDENVRRQTWLAVLALADKADPRDLVSLANRFDRGGVMPNLGYRIAVLKVAEAKQEAASAGDELAATRQNIGQSLMDQAKADPAQAAVYFRKALDYWVAAKAPPNIVDPLVIQLMRALLQTEDYAQAVGFAQSWIQKDDKYTTDVFNLVEGELRRQRDNKQYKRAMDLLNEAPKAPRLGEKYARVLESYRKEFERLLNNGGRRGPVRPSRYAMLDAPLHRG